MNYSEENKMISYDIGVESLHVYPSSLASCLKGLTKVFAKTTKVSRSCGSSVDTLVRKKKMSFSYVQVQIRFFI